MACAFRASSPYANAFAENREQIEFMAKMLISQDHGLVLVADVDGDVVGMIGMMIYPHHLSGEPTAGEICWWVDPPYRGCGKQLLLAAEAWALVRGAKIVQMMAPTPEVGQIYQKCGYFSAETTWVRRL